MHVILEPFIDIYIIHIFISINCISPYNYYFHSLLNFSSYKNQKSHSYNTGMWLDYNNKRVILNYRVSSIGYQIKKIKKKSN